MSLKKIKNSIISVSDKSNLKLILPILKKYNIKIISSGGTYKKIKNLGYKCTEISKYTDSPEMLDGRVKTLHPKIYAGILNIRKNKKHKEELKTKGIPNIDLVIVDLYPFEKKLKDKIKFQKKIEYIDIGGHTLIRAAAKNFNDIAVISNINDYSLLSNELKNNRGFTSLNFRRIMSAKAFDLTAYYDSIISSWLNNELKIKYSDKKTIHGNLVKKLRYGENPHQEGSIYSLSQDLGLNKLHGKDLSYNNYNDIYSALSIIKSFKKNIGTVIVKHANPCGASIEKNQIESYRNALICDPISAFGGVVAVNSSISKKLAYELNKTFFEVIVCNGFKKGALNILKRKKNIRIIDSTNFNITNDSNYLFLGNAFLLQDTDNILTTKKMRTVTIKKPSLKELSDLKFAFNMCKFVKSNAIVLTNKKSTIGIGSGQPSRLDSCRIATTKALNFVPEKITNSMAASDAFFPFTDGVQELIDSGIKAIIQPGGSINDKDVIKLANKAGVIMVFTETRHFKH